MSRYNNSDGQNTDPQSMDYPNGRPQNGLHLEIIIQMSAI